MKRDEPKDVEGAEPALEALVADAFAKRGELPPTTEAEVLAAMADGVEHEGELPASLAAPSFERASAHASAQTSERAPASAGAASQRVVSLDDLRRQREKLKARPSWASHAVTFGLGAAAAAALLVSTRPRPTEPSTDPAAGVPTTSASTPIEAPPAPLSIPAVTACAGECCAGSACAAAKGELRKCVGGKTCLGCEESPTAAYRVRIGNLVPARKTEPERLRSVDLCVRVGASAWSCEPAVQEVTARPEGRTLPTVVSAADLRQSIELELRTRGVKEALGGWRESVRVGPTVLCHGLGALITTEKKDDLGSVAITLDDTHFVELARSAEVSELKAARRGFLFADVVPSLVETKGAGRERFALTVGPLDKVVADRLRWAVLEGKREAQVSLGADYVGSPQALP